MGTQRLMRFDDQAELVDHTAKLLLDAMEARQAARGRVSLCLTGGTLANAVYDRMAGCAPASAVKAGTIHLWWNWDYFLPTDNPERNSLQALSRLAGAFPLDPAKIHPIPASDASPDPEAGAAQYAQDLREAGPVDICLLELGPQGQVAGIFPHHLESPLQATVAGITDAPLTHPDLITLTRAGLNSCRELWILASGGVVADQLFEAMEHNPTVPASYLIGLESAVWLVDAPAARLLPFHHCSL